MHSKHWVYGFYLNIFYLQGSILLFFFFGLQIENSSSKLLYQRSHTHTPRSLEPSMLIWLVLESIPTLQDVGWHFLLVHCFFSLFYCDILSLLLELVQLAFLLLLQFVLSPSLIGELVGRSQLQKSSRMVEYFLSFMGKARLGRIGFDVLRIAGEQVAGGCLESNMISIALLGRIHSLSPIIFIRSVLRATPQSILPLTVFSSLILSLSNSCVYLPSQQAKFIAPTLRNTLLAYPIFYTTRLASHLLLLITPYMTLHAHRRHTYVRKA